MTESDSELKTVQNSWRNTLATSKFRFAKLLKC